MFVNGMPRDCVESHILLSLGGVNKTFIIWLELSSVIVRDHFVSVSIFFVLGFFYSI